MQSKQRRELIKYFEKLAADTGKSFRTVPTRRGVRMVCDGRGTTLITGMKRFDGIERLRKALGFDL